MTAFWSSMQTCQLANTCKHSCLGSRTVWYKLIYWPGWVDQTCCNNKNVSLTHKSLHLQNSGTLVMRICYSCFLWSLQQCRLLQYLDLHILFKIVHGLFHFSMGFCRASSWSHNIIINLLFVHTIFPHTIRNCNSFSSHVPYCLSVYF